MTSPSLPKIAVAEQLAQKIAALDAAKLPQAVRRKCEELLIDVVGLAVTARNEDYVKSVIAACDDDGPCTAIGHTRMLSAAAAALVNGTAIHGEDFDDTFEGGPVHAGAVIVPAVLAACERHHRDGRAALLGIAVGVETMCRLSSRRADAHAQSRISSDRGVRHDGRGRRRRRRARPLPAPARRCARQCRFDGRRHHRISRRRRVDETAACRLGGASRHPRGATWPRRILRSAHRVRRRAWILSCFRAHDGRRFRRGDGKASARIG